MEIEFFRRRGTRRVRDYAPLPPLLLTDGVTLDDVIEEGVDLDYETPQEKWEAHNTDAAASWSNDRILPSRFIDGKDVGSTVAWLQSEEGYPVPVRLSQIGAVAMRIRDGELRREEVVPLERVVSMIVDFFQWDEIEELAIALRESGLRLLPSERPRDERECFDFERMRKTTQNRSNDELIRLERQVLARADGATTLVDGRLDPRAGAFNAATDPVIGVIKTHSQSYLHPQGWRVFYSLQPGQRTPAFVLQNAPAAGNGQGGGASKLNLEVVTWYLRLDGAGMELPNWGIIRIELAREYFEQQLGGNPSALDQLSRCIREYRCCDAGYSRAPVSLHPIQRAEECLGALFAPSDTLAQRFYRLAGL